MRTPVAVLRGYLGQRAGDVQLRYRGSRRLDPNSVRAGKATELLEYFALQRENLFLGLQNLAFKLLQLRRGEALGVEQSLLALVIGGRQMQVGLRDFDVVAKNIIEADLERRNARAGALALLNLREVNLAMVRDVAQLI